MPLTIEQSNALTTRNVSVALSAGAGCGKTHVLTERFLSHLEPQRNAAATEPARLHQLIAITFTDAAAREMRSRIRTACYDRLKDPRISEEAADGWVRLLRLIETARISTIHAFCTSLLRQHAVAAQLDPGFGVLDQGDADVLVSEVIDDVLRTRLATHDDLHDRTLELAAAFGLGRVKQQLQALLRGRRAAEFAAWLDKTPDDLVDAWRAYYLTRAWPDALREIAAAAPIDELLALLAEAGAAASKKAKFDDARAALGELLPRLKATAVDSDQLDTIRAQARVQAVCTAKDWPAKELYDRYAAACKAIRDAIDDHRPAPFNIEAARETARLGLDLLQLTADVQRVYGGRKAALGKLDFDDLLTKAHALITDSDHDALREQLSADLRLVLVDEFQDTDALQVELIKTLCGDGFDIGRLFFVGDFKQSIYRFRGAQPEVFHELRAQVPATGRLPLTENFRSQPAVLHFVNALFSDAFGNDYEPLRPHRAQVTTPAAVEFLWTPVPGKNSNSKGAAEAARRQEATRIARRLRALIDNTNNERPMVDNSSGKPAPRAVVPGDIAILFRTLSDVQVYEEALREFGLAYYLVGGHAFYAQQEIYDVLNLLRAVASPADEISLAGVLRSPFFSLEDETLFWLVEAGGREQGERSMQRVTGRLNAGVFADPLPKELSDSEQAKVIRAAATLHHLRAMKDRVPIATLLGEALARTGYDAVLLAEFLGQRKLANLQKLVERARSADQGGTLELDGFITQLAQFITQQPKEALAATAAETADVIRLMTIHQAKGLEFPLVVVPDLDRPPRLTAPVAALDAALGPLVPFPTDDDREKCATGMSLFAARERRAELEERKRLLYVACTRAADYFILSSSVESCDEPKSDWMNLIAARFDLSTGEPKVALPAAAKPPLVRVTLEEPATDFARIGKSRGPDLAEMLDAARQLTEDGPIAPPPHVGQVAVDRAARRQFSFSRLTGKLVRAERRPFAVIREANGDQGEPAVDPRGLGSLVHDVLERLDFAAANSAATVRDWCEHLAPLHVDHQAAPAAALAQNLIERLLASPRGQQMAQANHLHRELEFLLAWPSENKQHADSLPSPRYLHGYIDCLYQTGDGAWRLIDYKTNDVTAAECAAEARQYEMQLFVYAMAAEQSLGTPPAELALHFLRPGVEHVLPWNDAARQRATTLVNAAIEKLTNSI